MLGAFKKKGGFLYNLKQEKYFDLSASFYGGIYGYADKFSSSVIKKHLSKRKENLQLPQEKLTNFFMTQFGSLLADHTGRKLPSYFCPLLVDDNVLTHTLGMNGDDRAEMEGAATADDCADFDGKSLPVIHDHEIMFSPKKKIFATPTPAIITICSGFPYAADFFFECEKRNITPQIMIFSEKHSFFLGKSRLIFIDKRSPFAKKILQHAQEKTIDFWQLFIYIDMIRHHYKKVNTAKSKKQTLIIQEKIKAFESCQNVIVRRSNFYFPHCERMAILSLKDEKMLHLKKLQEKSSPNFRLFAEKNRLFFPTLSLCIAQKKENLFLFLPFNHEWHHLESRLEKLRNFLSK